MKYAKIKNGKVVDVINGLAPDDYVEVIQKWEAPKDFPMNFYATTSNYPIVSIVGKEVHENWGFILKDVEEIKALVYDIQKKNRKKLESVPVRYLDQDVDISTIEKRTAIMALKGKDKKFKAGKNKWIELSKKQVENLQELIDETVQSWFDSEYASNKELDSITTYEQLKSYLEG